MIGKPGVAKTFMTQLVSSIVEGGEFWEMLMAKDTTLQQLINDTEEHSILNTHFLFLDEMFKAQNKILNALLSILNERYYTIGGRKRYVPLITLFGASNEFPNGKDIEPFDDRLLFRYDVKKIQNDSNFISFVEGNFDKSKTFNTKIDFRHLKHIKDRADCINVPEIIMTNLINLRCEVAKRGIEVSDRKYGYLIKVMKVSAFINNREELDYSDLFLLLHTAWRNYIDRENIKKVLYQYFYGLKNSVEELNISVEKTLNDTSSEFLAKLGDFINFKIEFTPSTIKEYDKYIEGLSSFVKVYSSINIKLNKFYELLSMVTHIENQIKNNIFLLPQPNYTFTESNIAKANELKEKIESNILNIKNFIKEYETISEYSEMQNKKIRK